MARIRGVKPDFFKDEDLCKLPFEHRLFFQGLWCHADRDGRLEYRPQRLKVEIMPYDDVNVESICELLNNPQIPTRPNKRFIEIYEVDGEKYIQVITLKKHQKFHKDEKPHGFPGQQGASRVPAGCQQGASLNEEKTADKPLKENNSGASRVPAGCQQSASRPVSCILKSEIGNLNAGSSQLETRNLEPETQSVGLLHERTLTLLCQVYPQSGQQVGLQDGQVVAILDDEIPVADHGPLLAAAKNYADKAIADKTAPQFIRQLPNFLRDGYWRNFVSIKPTGTGPPGTVPDRTWKETEAQDRAKFEQEIKSGAKHPAISRTICKVNP